MSDAWSYVLCDSVWEGLSLLQKWWKVHLLLWLRDCGAEESRAPHAAGARAGDAAQAMTKAPMLTLLSRESHSNRGRNRRRDGVLDGVDNGVRMSGGSNMGSPSVRGLWCWRLFRGVLPLLVFRVVVFVIKLAIKMATPRQKLTRMLRPNAC